MKKLTKKQKRKADKVIKLLKELKKEGVQAYNISTIGSSVLFGRDLTLNDYLDDKVFEDWMNGKDAYKTDTDTCNLILPAGI